MSDMLGSQGKPALEQGVARNPSWTGRDAAALVEIRQGVRKAGRHACRQARMQAGT